MTQATMCTTRIQGKALSYQVKWSERARRLRISVSQAGVVVTLPKGFAAREAERFVQQNAAWVDEQMRRVEKARQKRARQTLPKDVILLRGKPTQVKVVIEADRKARALIRETAGRLQVNLPEGGGGLKGEVVERALRQMARSELEKAVAAHARVMRVSPKAVTVRDQRTRWGSCSTRGTLSFNWRLIMAPPEVLNYVVVHELSHLLQPNHSPAFWKVVAQYYPSFKEARLWLKRNTGLLRPELN
ncbi:M48 family peptidase [bacterium]|nr:M48 family peptidase [bacterium]